jgi:hypothetical protein
MYIYVHIYNIYLVGGFKHVLFSIINIWDVILPIDELIFFKMVVTTNQMMLYGYRKSMKEPSPKNGKVF